MDFGVRFGKLGFREGNLDTSEESPKTRRGRRVKWRGKGLGFFGERRGRVGGGFFIRGTVVERSPMGLGLPPVGCW